jgi:CRISPR-associated protein Cas5t
VTEVTVDVLKIVAEGPMTSFRYPHFVLGVQPTYEMPPPSTIYGHLCSALGDLVDPRGLRFAYHFTWSGQVDDLEHVHVLSPASGKLPGSAHPKVLEGNVNPFRRSLLFQPRLVLYVNRPDWESAFRSPRYAVVLGRSQDLFSYTSVTRLRLEEAPRAYFEATLAPYDLARRTGRGVVVLMPRFLDYSRNRAPHFDRYVVLRDRVYADELVRFPGEPTETYLVDPTAPVVGGRSLGLLFHSFVDERDGERESGLA